MVCDECNSNPEDNDDKFYHVRISNTGRDFAEGMVDKRLCIDCLESYIEDEGVSKIVSIVRIENPSSEEDNQ